jgi:hypothetical protein
LMTSDELCAAAMEREAAKKTAIFRQVMAASFIPGIIGLRNMNWQGEK